MGLLKGDIKIQVVIIISIIINLLLLPGSGSLPPHWAEQGGEGIPPDHQELVRAGDVRPGQLEAGPGQGRAAEHERPREQPGRRRGPGRRSWRRRGE